MMVNIKVNGKEYKKDVEPRMLLVSFLRDELGLTGTHIGCDTTNCGACTVLMDGKTVKSCTVLAVQANNHEITTIESNDPDLNAVKDSYVEEEGLQCGFCTPGMIMQSYYLIKNAEGDIDEDYIKKNLRGNLCRCTGYRTIIDSVKKAEEKLRQREEINVSK
ncbi:(2Fe-2S)-binding protein [Acidiplasma aeolicum]|jgi:aerobic-type carbon monoxide dehydrogenase small subunit (CoxS/CutS family)|uniref:(2Fe-2S)-binding protein n=2 Tax=Acidiplasma TaxID=507753 RepID=A0A0Q0XLF8_9ARCH|nr:MULTISPECIES: (2Fe-2S)-binding protein [Acidiplasma]KPV47547.1 (2Fe-2S)-binding protein [Acidiplasma aeolicum]KQB36018.1 (2Fe-2S)-binding protein [Acidiplasma aeolicum]KQB36195.1 (2Fe-2S)-binding protein [Acidiplasma cupricumulans]